MKSLKDKIIIDLAMDMTAYIQKVNPDVRKKIYELYSRVKMQIHYGNFIGKEK